MARQKKTCDFCSGEYEVGYIENRNGYCLWADVDIVDGAIKVIAQANDEEGELIEDYVRIDMNYCPVCGRRIK